MKNKIVTLSALTAAVLSNLDVACAFASSGEVDMQGSRVDKFDTLDLNSRVSAILVEALSSTEDQQQLMKFPREFLISKGLDLPTVENIMYHDHSGVEHLPGHPCKPWTFTPITNGIVINHQYMEKLAPRNIRMLEWFQRN